MKFRLNPTVREVNRYLSPLIDELTQKHVKVSNPEFEEELKQITGIGWKQAKNYKNHPKPGQRLNDNALINEWVFNCRKKDKKRQALLYLGIFIGVIGFVFLGIQTYSFLGQERVVIIKEPVGPKTTVPNISEDVITKYSLTIPSHDLSVKLGSLHNQKLDLKKFTCLKHSDTFQTCNLDTSNKNGSVLSSILYIQDGIVNNITISAVGEGSNYLNETLNAIKSLSLNNKELNDALKNVKPQSKIILENKNERVTITLGAHEGKSVIYSAQITLDLILN